MPDQDVLVRGSRAGRPLRRNHQDRGNDGVSEAEEVSAPLPALTGGDRNLIPPEAVVPALGHHEEQRGFDAYHSLRQGDHVAGLVDRDGAVDCQDQQQRQAAQHQPVAGADDTLEEAEEEGPVREPLAAVDVERRRRIWPYLERVRDELQARESLDAQAAAEYLHRQVQGEKIGAIGISLGGAAALLGSEPLPVDALVLESVYSTIEEATANRLRLRLGRFGPMLTPWFMLQMRMQFGISAHDLQPIERIRSMSNPIFIIAGTEDQHTTLAE